MRPALCRIAFSREGWRLFGGGILFLCFLFFAMRPADADEKFRAWVEGFWPIAQDSGISRQVYDDAFKGVTPDLEVVERALNQPEFSMRLSAYLSRILSGERVRDGLAKAEKYRRHLDEIEDLYGVDRYVVLAIWGMESHYGRYMGDRYVVRSLATLASYGIRQAFCRRQLIAALGILARGDMTREQLRGSWAGAVGHTQFIPTTFESFAVDMDSDGERDLRGNFFDALGSTAHYLRKSGWQGGRSWGYPVRVPPGFDYGLADETIRSLVQWEKHGLRRLDGSALSPDIGDSMLIFPVGARGTAVLVGQNFRAILMYNPSQHYALAVSLLSDRLRGEEIWHFDWQVEEDPLTLRERKELQIHLKNWGEYFGKIDGMIGPVTRRAIRSYQRKIGVPADGYPGNRLLRRLRQESE